MRAINGTQEKLQGLRRNIVECMFCMIAMVSVLSLKHAFIPIFLFLFINSSVLSPAPALSRSAADLGAAPSQSKADDDAAPNAGNWWETAEAIKLEYSDRQRQRLLDVIGRDER